MLDSSQPANDLASSADNFSAPLAAENTSVSENSLPAENKAGEKTFFPRKNLFQKHFKMFVGLFFFVLVGIGGVAAYSLSQTSQDLRQQAAGGAYRCSRDNECQNGLICVSSRCVQRCYTHSDCTNSGSGNYCGNDGRCTNNSTNTVCVGEGQGLATGQRCCSGLVYDSPPPPCVMVGLQKKCEPAAQKRCMRPQ